MLTFVFCGDLCSVEEDKRGGNGAGKTRKMESPRDLMCINIFPYLQSQRVGSLALP